MTNKSFPASLTNRLSETVRRFLYVKHEERLWARRGEVVMLLSTIAMISTILFMVFIMAPSVMIRQAFDVQTNLFWLYCLIFLIGQSSVMWITKQGMVREGALLLIFMSAGVLVAMSVVGGLATWALSMNMGLMIMIVMAGGMLGRNAALIASVVITALEACLITLNQPAVGYDLLLDSAWYNFSLAGLLWGILKPLEQLADEAEHHVRGMVVEDGNQATRQRTHAELAEHLQEHSKRSFGVLKVHLRTLSDDENLSADSREALEAICLHMNRVQHASDEMLDYVMLTQPGMPAPTLEEYRPVEIIMGLQRHFMTQGVGVDLITNGSLPRTVLGMPAATRRALIHLAEYVLRLSDGSYLQIEGRIEGNKGWRVRIVARYDTPPTTPGTTATDAITVMASDTLRAMGGLVKIEPTDEDITAAVILPFKMMARQRRIKQ